jgi:hypothetical protein
MENQKPNELWRVLKKFYGTKKNVEHNSMGMITIKFSNFIIYSISTDT